MKLHDTQGPDEGSLTVTFRCPECGFRVAMLTNPFETQMVKSLGVKVGAAPVATPEPLQHLRGAMAGAQVATLDGASADAGAESTTGGGCPFAAMLSETEAVTPAVTWTSEAEARMERVPSFIRPMARKAIERFAETKGYPAVTEAVMDEARGALGM